MKVTALPEDVLYKVAGLLTRASDRACFETTCRAFCRASAVAPWDSVSVSAETFKQARSLLLFLQRRTPSCIEFSQVTLGMLLEVAPDQRTVFEALLPWCAGLGCLDLPETITYRADMRCCTNLEELFVRSEALPTALPPGLLDLNILCPADGDDEMQFEKKEMWFTADAIESLVAGVTGLEALRISVVHFDRAPALPPTLEDLYLRGVLSDAGWGNFLAQLPRGLTSLLLTGHNGDIGLEPLAAMPELRALGISWYDTADLDSHLRFVPTTVTHLFLDNEWADECQAVPPSLTGLTALRKLCLDSAIGLHNLPRGLTALTLFGKLDFLDEEEWKECVDRLPSLNRLSLQSHPGDLERCDFSLLPNTVTRLLMCDSPEMMVRIALQLVSINPAIILDLHGGLRVDVSWCDDSDDDSDDVRTAAALLANPWPPLPAL